MNKQKGYTLVEVAIVLVIISLLMGAGIAGFKNYRERAEYLADGRGSELEQLIAMDKGKIAAIDEPIPDPSADPAPEAEVVPEFEEDPVIVDKRPRWVRWMEWWKNLGWGNNSRRNRNG
jgi:prepilin-type N-terminal cleavage/methylation domain-containing protein